MDFDIIVIGAGGAGITASLTANGFGKRVALIEKNKIGGECTWSGCVPSKSLIKTANAVHQLTKLRKLGIDINGNYEIDTSRVMEHVRDVILKVYEEEKPEVFEEKGIKVFIGEACFVSKNKIKVGNETITGKKIIIATGTRPFVPKIEGLEDVDYLTNENIFKLEKLPTSLLVVGAGPIGIELSQAMNRLGVEVRVLLRDDRILQNENKELATILKSILVEEGIIFENKISIKSFKKLNGNNTVVIEEQGKENREITFNKVLFATGRNVTFEGMNLEEVGITYSKKGIKVNNSLETSVENIYACGDVVGPYRFSHMAEYQGVIAALNCILPIKRKVNYENVPWTTFSDPELAHIGLSEEESRKQLGNKLKVHKYPYAKLDRAITDGNTKGFVKVYTNQKGRVIGADILGERGGELIHEVEVFKQFGLSIKKSQGMIHAYPTYSDAIRKIGKQAYLQGIQENSLVKLGKRLTVSKDENHGKI